jgi:hypothetical protein
MTATMPPAGTSNVACDQISRPPRSALTSANASAVSVSLSGSDTKSLGQGVQLLVLPTDECRFTGCDRLGDLDHRDPAVLSGFTDLFRYRTLGLGVVDQNVDLLVGQGFPERLDIGRRRFGLVGRRPLVPLRGLVDQAEGFCLIVENALGGRVGLAGRARLDLLDQD